MFVLKDVYADLLEFYQQDKCLVEVEIENGIYLIELPEKTASVLFDLSLYEVFYTENELRDKLAIEFVEEIGYVMPDGIVASYLNKYVKAASLDYAETHFQKFADVTLRVRVDDDDIEADITYYYEGSRRVAETRLYEVKQIGRKK